MVGVIKVVTPCWSGLARPSRPEHILEQGHMGCSLPTTQAGKPMKEDGMRVKYGWTAQCYLPPTVGMARPPQGLPATHGTWRQGLPFTPQIASKPTAVQEGGKDIRCPMCTHRHVSMGALRQPPPSSLHKRSAPNLRTPVHRCQYIATPSGGSRASKPAPLHPVPFPVVTHKTCSPTHKACPVPAEANPDQTKA